MNYDNPFPTSNPTSNHAAALFLHAFSGNTGAPPTTPGVQTASLRNEQAQVGRLIHCGQTIERLKEDAWYDALPTTLTEQLEGITVPAILLRLYENGSSGVLTARNRQGQQRTVALVGGTPTAIASLNVEGRLGSYLVESGRLDARVAKQAMRLMTDEDKPLGWALLKLGAVGSNDLLRALQTHAEQSLTGMFGWSDGEVLFREASMTAELRRVIDTPFIALVRQAYSHIYRQDGATLRSFTAPFFQREEPLVWREVPQRLESLAEGVHPALLECWRKNGTPSTLANVMKPHDATQFNRNLADIYVLTQLGMLTFGAGRKYLHLATIPTKFHDSDGGKTGSSTDPLATYRQQQEAVVAARRLLSAFKPEEAVKRLGSLVQESANEPPLEALSYLAIALALVGDKERSMEYALRALKRQPHDALAHAAVCRAFEAAGNHAQAGYHHKNALALAQKNPVWHAEIDGALKMQASSQALKEVEASNTAGRALPLWMLAISVMVVLFAMTNVLHIGGNREYYYAWDEPFFYIRRLVLALVGGLGVCIWRGQSPVKILRNATWRLPWAWVGRVALYGAVVGVASPMQRISGDVATVTAMCLLHALCEEIFFRGFITTMLFEQLVDVRLAVLTSAALYALYHLTYFSFWQESGWQVKMYYIGMIAAFTGVPYALMLRHFKSITASVACHASVGCFMMWFSFFRRH